MERRKLAESERLKRLKAYRLAFVSLLLMLVVGAEAWYIYARRTKEAIAESKVQDALKTQAEAEQKEKKAVAAQMNAEECARSAEQARKDAVLARTQFEQDVSQKIAQLEKDKNDVLTKFSIAEETSKKALTKATDLQQANKVLEREVEKQITGKRAAEDEALKWRGLYIEAEKKLKEYQNNPRQSNTKKP